MPHKWAEPCARFLNRLQGEGINDLWIAACCLVQGLPLVTNNLGDFGQIATNSMTYGSSILNSDSDGAGSARQSGRPPVRAVADAAYWFVSKRLRTAPLAAR